MLWEASWKLRPFSLSQNTHANLPGNMRCFSYAEYSCFNSFNFCSARELYKSLLLCRPVRTLEDGPTARQKVLVLAIWILAAIFGFMTCFPEKLLGVGVTPIEGGILPSPISSATPTSASVSVLLSADENGGKIQTTYDAIVSNTSAQNTIKSKKELELTFCSMKNGVNDMLDYIALMVALVAPLIIGPCIVGVFQVSLCSHYATGHPVKREADFCNYFVSYLLAVSNDNCQE